MSSQYTFEIENFSAGKNLIIDIHSALFTQFPHLPVGTVGATKKTAEQAKEIIIYRSFDQDSHLFTIQTGQTFPKAFLRIKNWDGGKNYLFTFRNVVLDYQIPFIKDNKPLEEVQFLFDEFSIKEESPVGNTARPGKRKNTADTQQAAVMNFVKG